MFDLKNLDRWKRCGKAALAFNNAEPRRVRLEVLAEEPTRLYASHEGLTGQYIGTFEGYDVVQFHVPGPWKLTSSSPAFVWSPELDGSWTYTVPDVVSFTRKMERRKRNPELEAMMHVMNRNMERRLAQVERDATLSASAAIRAEVARQRSADIAARRAAAERDEDDESDEDAEADESASAG